MSLSVLKKNIKKHGKAKVAVALNLKETCAINNWLKRKEIPKAQKKNVQNLKTLDSVTANFCSGRAF